jgi:hypothetical protein
LARKQKSLATLFYILYFGFQWLLMAMGLGEFLPSNWLIDWFASVACDVGGAPGICESILFLLCGYDEAQV